MSAPTPAAGPDAGDAAPAVRRRWRPPVWLVALLVTVAACVAVARALDVDSGSPDADLTAAVTVLVGALVGGLAAAVTVVALGVMVSRLVRPSSPTGGALRRGAAVGADVVLFAGGTLAVLSIGALSLFVAFVGLLGVDAATRDRSAVALQEEVGRRLGGVEGISTVSNGEVASLIDIGVRRDAVVVRADLDPRADQEGRERAVAAAAAALGEQDADELRALVLLTDGRLTVDVTGSAAAGVERLAVATALLEGTDARTVAVLRHASATGVLSDQPGGDEQPEAVRLVGPAAPADLVTQALAVLPASWSHETSVEVATTAAPDPGFVDPDDASLLAGRRSLSVEPSRHHRDVMVARALDAEVGVLGYSVGDDDGPTEDRVGVADPARADEVIAAVRAARGLRDADVMWGAAPRPVVTVLAPGRDGRPVEVAVG